AAADVLPRATQREAPRESRKARGVRRERLERHARGGRTAEVEQLAERRGQAHLATLDRVGEQKTHEALRDRTDLEVRALVRVLARVRDRATVDERDREVLHGPHPRE